MVELVSFGIFLASLGVVFYMISKKVPLLLAVPEQLINESFITRPPRLKRVELFIRSLFVWERYESAALLFLEKTLRRIHILLLKGDALVTKWLTRIQNRSYTAPPLNTRFWREIRVWKKDKKNPDIPETSRPAPHAPSKIDGIRRIFSK